MAKEPTKTDKTQPEWAHIKGTLVPGSVKDIEAGVEATMRSNASGKEIKLIAYARNAGAVEALKAEAETGATKVFSGPMLGSVEKGSFHIGLRTVKEPTVAKEAQKEAEVDTSPSP